MKIGFIHNEKDPFEYNNCVDVLLNYNDSKDMRYAFWDVKNSNVKWYPSAALDLLYISLSVYAADRICLRKNAADSWSRKIELYIPVLDKAVWEKSKVILEEMLSFLSGDSWRFKFYTRTESKVEIYAKNRWDKQEKEDKNYNKVCMFSGGLDSFVGAIDLLENGEKPLFVSHYGGGKGTKEYQDSLIGNFIEQYAVDKDDFKQFHATILGGSEETTRTRSFMFFSHAIALASTLSDPIELIIPENGLISLNIPSTFSRIGSSSTRTTHPFYMRKFQDLINNIGLNIVLKNPYQFKTKGEMLEKCQNPCFLKNNLANTMSCSHPDVGRCRGESHTMHCGYCLPCVIRKAAIKRANLEDNSVYYDLKCEKVKVAKINLNSYKQGLKKYNEKYAFMTIQQNGPVLDNIQNYTDTYIRGIEEVKKYIEEI